MKMNQLESGVQRFVDDLSKANLPPIYDLPILEARNFLDTIQSQVTYDIPAQIEDTIIDNVSIRIVRPANYQYGILPTIIYVHGGGWILGNKYTHDRLIREISNGSNAAIVFVNYTPSPEARYPIALEEIYTVLKYVSQNGNLMNLDPNRLAIMGDSVGGNMAAVVSLLAKYRGGPHISYQVLAYPVTEANFDTESYNKFANGPWLTKEAMKWYFDAYCPDYSIRQNPTVSPLNATLEQLSGLPSTLIITDENDVLRDQGEKFAHKLMQAGVDTTSIRFIGTIHDFLMLNPIANTNATRSAIKFINMNLIKVLW